jgi:integrase
MTTNPPLRRNTGRPGLEPGTSGAPWTKKLPNGRWRAAAWVRGSNGSKRQVSASGASKGAALRNLQRKLDTTLQPGAHGMQPNWLVAEAGSHWRARIEHVGSVATGRRHKPQTLAAYDSELSRIIVPTIGQLRLSELTIPLIEAAFAELENQGMSTAQARTVMNGIFTLAVRDGAMRSNPLPYVSLPVREPKEVEILIVDGLRHLRAVTHPDFSRTPGRRGPNRDLFDVITTLAGTGMRMDPATPEWYVRTYTRQPTTKTNHVRTLTLPEAVALQLRDRRSTSRFTEPQHPLFASSRGQFLWAANLRTRLREAVAGEDSLVGTTPHTLRRTVASLVAYEHGLDAARRQLGHVVVSGALARYVAHQTHVPDYTDVLDHLFSSNEPPEEDA